MSNTNNNQSETTPHNYPSQSGGRDAILRILQAYGFTSRQALCRRLGVSQSTMANRWMRDTFPHDWLIACHLDTGASLLWLSSGQGDPMTSQNKDEGLHLELKKITNGVEESCEGVRYDAQLIPDGAEKPYLVEFEGSFYLVDEFSGEVNDGYWLIEIDAFLSIRRVNRLPGRRLRIENGPASFECSPEDIRVLGKVITKTEYL
nr:MAG TPA: CI repressor [Caudoviricetes sp.]